MAVYAYKVISGPSATASGVVTADTPRQARDLLRRRGLVLTEIVPMPQVRSRPRRGRRDSQEITSLVRELSTLLSAGIALLPALQTLARQHGRRLRATIEQISEEISSGVSLADALAHQGDYFDELCVSIVHVGENTGSLDTSLRRLADFREKTHKLRSRIASALLYPAVVCLVGLAVAVFLMTYVVPNLLGTLTQAGRPLPVVTQIVKSASDFIVHWWWLVLLAIASLTTAARLALRRERGRLIADGLLLRVPLVGPLVRKEITSRLAVVLAALLKSGLQFVDAIRVARRTVGNRVFRRALEDYEAAVTAGGDVAGPLEASAVFQPMVVQMLAVGQQSGELEEMLDQLATTYDQEVATAAHRLTSVLEPALIVLLAVLVGFIAFATILPILEVSNVL